MIDEARILNTFGKMYHHLDTHENICVSVSGGSDSDIIVHMISTYYREFLPKIHFVFINTGLEYDATLSHLKYLEDKYEIKISRIKGTSVVYAVKHYGTPIVSKSFSDIVQHAQNGRELALKKINYTKEESPRFYFSKKQKELALYLVNEKPFKVASYCCDASKKKPIYKYMKDIKADLTITGERYAEGGIRATSHKDCFEHNKRHNIDKYMPLWFWNDETKEYYKKQENITYSDCYEVWGMCRTGCVGCPFNARVGDDLKIMQKFEPLKYKACLNVFGKSYELMDKFNIHKKRIFENQITIEDL